MDNFQKSLFNSARFYKKWCCMWVFGCTYIRISCWNRCFEHKGVKSWSFNFFLNFFFKPNDLFQSWAMEMQSVWVFYLFLPPSWICHTKSELDSVPSLVRLKYTKFTSASRQAAPQDCPETARMLSMEKSAVPKARRTLKPRSCPALAHGVLPAGLWTEQELFACVCVRAFVYGLGHCFHFRRNKINPFDILALSLLGSNWWWIIQIWQRVLSALKLHFSTFAGKICQL